MPNGTRTAPPLSWNWMPLGSTREESSKLGPPVGWVITEFGRYERIVINGQFWAIFTPRSGPTEVLPDQTGTAHSAYYACVHHYQDQWHQKYGIAS
jgi:hypothetical protein